MEKEKCAICHHPVMIPVQLKCFDCKCSKLNVSCKTCADIHLELNKRDLNRNEQAKCPNCEKTCNLFGLHKEGAYEEDMMVMKIDKSRYPCTQACGFEGEQLDIFDHLIGCPKRLVKCEYKECEDWYPHDKKQEHDLVCRAYTTCEYCPQRIKTTDYKRHVERHKCSLCSEYSFKSSTEHKMTECAYLQKCQYCENKFLLRDIMDHYKTHLDSVNKLRHDISLSMGDLDRRFFNSEFSNGSDRIRGSYRLKRREL